MSNFLITNFLKVAGSLVVGNFPTASSKLMKKRRMAIVYAFLLGMIGGHRFYLRQYYLGATYFLVAVYELVAFKTLSLPVLVFVICDIIWLLRVSEEQFDQIYNPDKRRWRLEMAGRVQQKTSPRKNSLFSTEFFTRVILQVRWRRLSRHIPFWLLAYLLYLAYLALGQALSTNDFLILTVNFGLIVLACLNNNFLLNRYVFNNDIQNYSRYLLGFLVLLLVFVAYVLLQFVARPSLLGFAVSTWTYPGVFFLLALSSGFFKAANSMVVERKISKRLQRVNSANQLRFLKAQLQPHFLLNTINNIYSLALTGSERTSSAVLHLSELLKYLLENTEGRTSVPLQQEIHFIRMYLALEELRLGSTGRIKIKVHGEVSQQKIIPLLFITFIENSIKHGLNSNPETGFIQIHFYIQQDAIDFRISNNYAIVDPVKARTGIGLRNVRRQLDLKYSGRHNLEIIQQEAIYTVKLYLQLHEN